MLKPTPEEAPSLPLRARLSARFLSLDPALRLVGLLLCAYYLLTRGIFEGKASGDGYVAYHYFPGLVFHHTLDLAAVGVPSTVAAFGREATGRVANPNPIGPPLLWAPFYFLGLLLKQLVFGVAAIVGTHAPKWFVSGVATLRGEKTEFDFFMTGLGGLVAGLLGAGRLFAFLRRRVSIGAARFAVATTLLASPLWWYLTTQPLYQHACAFFAVTLLIERWDFYRSSAEGLTLRRAAFLGFFGGLCLLMRTQEALWLLLPGVDLLTGFLRALREGSKAARAALGRGLCFAGCAVLTFVPQALVWYYYYGAVRPPQKAGHIRWGDPAFIELLFSMRAGIFPWVPALYLALPGLALLLWRRGARALTAALCLGALGQLYVNAAVFDFHASWSFGPRRMTDCAIVLGFGLAVLYEALRRRGQRVVTVVAVLLICWNGLLTELMRERKIKSSSSGAFPASVWVSWAKGPAWLERLFDRVGYPFTQPASAVFCAAYRVSPRVFEGILGNYILDRDIAFRSVVVNRTISLTDPWTTYVVEGAPPPGTTPKGAAVPVGPRLRVLVPLRVAERLRFFLRGEALGPPGALTARWNGRAVPLKPFDSAQRSGAPSLENAAVAEVPAELSHGHARVNELVIEGLPPGARLRQIDFESLGTWWR